MRYKLDRGSQEGQTNYSISWDVYNQTPVRRGDLDHANPLTVSTHLGA